ncbi:Chaperone J-domain-containing protein [Glarea lozoyensis ATCC 20868]|uniref:Chaperone J-domain-containing protein n=1 Tax=Glarea lozoyensis (strain ATCC 20868 / MF5171) TaxID=1116229 RepID=S3EBT3_GLAL2|nr:Chaperone J-domain-containing protein [Glarea lozoyensis ATCC 20868]EPE35758.1 Chaperone J-domain-containing protein [Glarea lozoyensis ATCC 20868]
MSGDTQQAQKAFVQEKDDIIQDVLHEEDLYKILGAPRGASAAELRRCYLERSKICHPDKPPFHPESTSAFQRLGFAFDILRSPSARRTYDRASKPTSSSLPDKTTFLGGEHTFRSAVEAILQEFMTGDFVIVRRWLESLHAQYPNLVSEEVVINVERSFIRIRELVLTTRTYALLIYIELGRIHRVQKRLMGLRYLDIVGRARLSVHLVRVTLAVPMRVDRALKQREEKAWRAKVAGLQARGIATTETMGQAGILNDRVSKVLEFIVGVAGKDEGADEAWSTSMGQRA